MKTALLSAIGASALSVSAAAGLVDGSFENNDIYYGWGFVQGGIDTTWLTTAPDNLIEIWGEYMEVPAYEGTRCAELNANYASTLYQSVAPVSAGSAVNWHFAHHGRYGTDTMRLTITDLGGDQVWGGGDDTTVYTNEFSADNTAWVVNYGSVSSLGNSMRFAFEAVSAVGGNTQGNLIDWCDFGVGVVPAPGAISLLAIGTIIGGTRRRR
jgi:hypothetical protein